MDSLERCYIGTSKKEEDPQSNSWQVEVVGRDSKEIDGTGKGTECEFSD